MSKSRKARQFRRAVRKEYSRELTQYWKLSLMTRIKLAWAIARGKHE